MIKKTAMMMLLAALPLQAFGDAEALFAEAEQRYERRQSLAQVNQAIDLLRQANTEATDTDLKVKINVLWTRCIYWKGVRANGSSAKQRIFTQAMNKAKVVQQLDDGYAEGYYFYAISLGRWAQARGVTASLSRRAELFRNINKAKERETMSGQDGEKIDGYGPLRTLGRAYDLLPVIAGGSRTKAIRNLRKAHNRAPNFLINTVYYGSVLAKGNANEKAEGCALLERAKNQRAGYNQNRIPETRIEKKDAETEYNALCS